MEIDAAASKLKCVFMPFDKAAQLCMHTKLFDCEIQTSSERSNASKQRLLLLLVTRTKINIAKPSINDPISNSLHLGLILPFAASTSIAENRCATHGCHAL